MATMRLLLTTAFILWLATTSRAADELNRWAIVASADVQKTGLADLVLAEASKLERIEFVERDALDRVVKELELESLAGSGGVSQRMNAGRALRADALVLLTSVSKAESSRLRVVVCDARQGTRLATFETEVEKASLDRTAKSVVAEIARVRDHFADGVRLVVGVTPFVSRNLEHRHDHCQSRFAELLANSLTSQRGVAVIEVEEARAILKERALHAEEAVTRRVPFIVSGQFRMTSRDGASEPDVELTIELTSAKSVQKLPVRTIELSRTPQWLVGDLSLELLKTSGGTFEPLDAETQQVALIRQANSFSQLGDWRRSLGLREAALVLDPVNAEQRVRLILDYQVCFTRDFARLWSYQVPPDERALLIEQATDQFITAQEHLEYVIRNRQISHGEAVRLLRRQSWEGPGDGQLLIPMPGKEAAERLRLRRVLDADERFLSDSFMEVVKLPESPTMPTIIQPRHHEFEKPWWTVLLNRALKQVQIREFDAHSLKFMKRVLTEMVPEDVAYPEPLSHLAYAGRSLSNDAQKDEWRKFLTELATSKSSLASFFGRAQLREISSGGLRALGTSDKAELQASIRSAEAILRDFEGRRPIGDNGVEGVRSARDHTKRYLDQTPHVNAPEPRVEGSLGRLHFQPLDWKVTSSTAGTDPKKLVVPILQNMCRCGDELDVHWTQKSLFFMNRPGELRLLPFTEHRGWAQHGTFSHVTWDGENVWLVVVGRGIFVLNRNGDVVTQFHKETPMPGIDAGLQMLPLAPRRMLVVGSFGEHHRAWCGVLEVSDTHQPSVRIVHEATRVFANRPKAEVEADIGTAFVPQWIHRVERRDASPLAFVGRSRCANALAIDLDSFAVSLVPFYPRAFPGNESHFRQNGRFVNQGTEGVFAYQQLESGAVADEKRLIYRTHPYAQLLVLGDRAYVSGPVWWSLHTTSLQTERLLPGTTELPEPYRSLRHGVSAHYGLIGFRRYVPPKEIGVPTIFQITVADEATSPASR